MRHVFQRGSVVLLMFAALCIGQFAVAAAVPAAPVPSEVKSFREWKQSRIQEQEQRIQALKERLGPHRSFATDDPNLVRTAGAEGGLQKELQQQLTVEQESLAITRDLSISDYFVGYLTKQASLDSAIKQVSGRLTPEEVAELMSAYAQHFFRTRPSSLKTSPRADSGL